MTSFLFLLSLSTLFLRWNKIEWKQINDSILWQIKIKCDSFFKKYILIIIIIIIINYGISFYERNKITGMDTKTKRKQNKSKHNIKSN